MAVRSENVTARTEPKPVSEMSKAEYDLMMKTGLEQAKNGESLDADEVFDELLSEI